jgi:hypothetical protein
LTAPSERNGMDAKILKLIEATEKRRFFGKVELEYRDGQIILIRLNETVLPDSVERNEWRERCRNLTKHPVLS